MVESKQSRGAGRKFDRPPLSIHICPLFPSSACHLLPLLLQPCFLAAALGSTKLCLYLCVCVCVCVPMSGHGRATVPIVGLHCRAAEGTEVVSVGVK